MKKTAALKLVHKHGVVTRDEGLVVAFSVDGIEFKMYFSQGSLHSVWRLDGEDKYGFESVCEAVASAKSRLHKFNCRCRSVDIWDFYYAKDSRIIRRVSVDVDDLLFTSDNPTFITLCEGAVEDGSPGPLLDWLLDNHQIVSVR